MNYELFEQNNAVPVKAWIRGVPFDDNTREQVLAIARLPIIFRHVALMPDCHLGKGSTVGSVIPTQGAIIPAAVGVDIGCGMMAVETNLVASDLPDNLAGLRAAIEKAVPHGRTNKGGRGDRGAWANVPDKVAKAWTGLENDFGKITDKFPKIAKSNHINHLGSLGGGNHFVEVCLDESDRVWFMLHSGSRGVGNRIGSIFIEMAKEDMRVHEVNLPDRDLAYLQEGTEHFDDYVFALDWAQRFALTNREVMMASVFFAASKELGREVMGGDMAVNAHHNYAAQESHYGEDIWVTRKGAVSAQKDQLGIIPGSMGARSFIVRGKGNRESFCSCSHGAGRVMSRTQAKKVISLEDHIKATDGVECRKDEGVRDESPAAYKNIDDVMAAQSDLVDIVHTLKQVVCVKG